jgi:cell division protein FtsL
MKNRNTYVNGSNAYAPERSRENPLTREEYEKLNRAKIERTNRIKQKKNAKKRKAMFTIVGAFVVGVSLIWSEAQVYGVQNKLTKMKKEIVEVGRSNEDLKIQLGKVTNIRNVENVAEQKLHMKKPEVSKFLYVDLAKNNFSEIPEDNSQGKLKELITKIKSLLF